MHQLPNNGPGSPLEALELLDKESGALGGLFQQIVHDLKVRGAIFRGPLIEYSKCFSSSFTIIFISTSTNINVNGV